MSIDYLFIMTLDIKEGKMKGKKTSEKTFTDEKMRMTCSAMGKIGGPLGGKARALKLSKKRRSQIARQGGLAKAANHKKRNTK